MAIPKVGTGLCGETLMRARLQYAKVMADRALAGGQAAWLRRVMAVTEKPVYSVAPLDLGLLFDPNSNMVAMREAVTVGQMRLFVQDRGYRPEEGSCNAGDFDNLIKEGDASAPMVFTNEADCLAFIKWALPKAQAQDPRIQTLGLPSNDQWVRMRQAFKGPQRGKSWESWGVWERLKDTFFFFPRAWYSVSIYRPEDRALDTVFRLVGTYQKISDQLKS